MLSYSYSDPPHPYFFLLSFLRKDRQTNNLIFRITMLDSLEIQGSLEAKVCTIRIVVIPNHAANLDLRRVPIKNNVLRRRTLYLDRCTQLRVLACYLDRQSIHLYQKEQAASK